MTDGFFCEAAYSHRRLLYHVAYTILRDSRDCEDAVQEALCRAWEKRHTLREESAFRFWLVKILANTCRRMGKARRRAPAMAELTEDLPAPPGEGPENRALHDAISQLPEELRLAVVLHYLEGFTTREIAGLIRRPEGTVRNRLFRARQQLKVLLGEEMEE